MLPCPSCHSRISRVPTPKGVIYGCPKCGGRSVAVPVLRKDASSEFVRKLLTAFRDTAEPSERECCHCGRPMTKCSVWTMNGTVELDYCHLCNQVWFDPGEYESVPPAPPPDRRQLSPEAREAIATFELASHEELDPGLDEEAPDSAWQYIPAFLGLPVEFNDTPVAHRPWVTWGLSAFMIVLFAGAMATGTLKTLIEQGGFIPSHWARDGGMTVLWSFLLHAGVWHLVSNLYFFLVFADNVEDHLGVGKFMLLLLAAHVAGLLIHAVGDPRGDMPLVGASGGICGVLAYYAVTFPRAKVGFMLWFWWVFRWFRISAAWALVLFVGLQLLGAWLQHQGLSNVSAFGHIGGLIVGLAAGLWGRIAERRHV